MPRSRSVRAAAARRRPTDAVIGAGAHHLDVQPARAAGRAARLARPRGAHQRGPTAPSCWRWATPSSTAASTPSSATSTANTLDGDLARRPERCSRSPTSSGSDLMEASFSSRLRPAVGDAFRDRSRPAGEGHPGAPAERRSGPTCRRASSATRAGRSRARPAGWRRTARCWTTEPGRKAYLIADPMSGGVVAYNPLPDPQAWTLTTRDGASFMRRRQGRAAAAGIPAVVARGRDQPCAEARPEGRRSGQRLTISGLAQAPPRVIREWPPEPT